jgi:hypothetical protein
MLSGHAFDTRDGKGKIATVPPPQGRADHTDWVIASQESVALRQVDESAAKSWTCRGLAGVGLRPVAQAPQAVDRTPVRQNRLGFLLRFLLRFLRSRRQC